MDLTAYKYSNIIPLTLEILVAFIWQYHVINVDVDELLRKKH